MNKVAAADNDDNCKEGGKERKNDLMIMAIRTIMNKRFRVRIQCLARTMPDVYSDDNNDETKK